MNLLPYFKCKLDEKPGYIESPQKERRLSKHSKLQNIWDALRLGSRNDKVNGATDEQKENEMHNTWEDHFEKTVESKLENLRLNLQNELKEIQERIKRDLEEILGRKKDSTIEKK